MCNEVIALITKTGYTEDDAGYTVPSEEHEVEIFAQVKSVKYGEYYAALAAGVEAQVIFVIDKDDYELSAADATDADGNTYRAKASQVRYDGDTYRIVRRYRTDAGMLELTCAEVS